MAYLDNCSINIILRVIFKQTLSIWLSKNMGFIYYYSPSVFDNNVPLQRKFADKCLRVSIVRLLQEQQMNLFILNGRFGEDKISHKLTCKDSSTVDYFISSGYNFAHIAALKVFDFSQLYSDPHCPITPHIG